jgi:hypothetical protein
LIFQPADSLEGISCNDWLAGRRCYLDFRPSLAGYFIFVLRSQQQWAAGAIPAKDQMPVKDFWQIENPRKKNSTGSRAGANNCSRVAAASFRSKACTKKEI